MDVRFVKRLDTAQPPWLPHSEFSHLRADLQGWRLGLASCLEFSPENIYIRLESSQFGALALLHCTYHHAMLDLYRIFLPELFRLGNAVTYPPEQSHFLHRMQSEGLGHAQSIAIVLAETARRGPRFVADSMLHTFAYNSNRFMLYYIARVLDLGRPNAMELVKETIEYVQSNNKVMRVMSAVIPLAEQLVCSEPPARNIWLL